MSTRDSAKTSKYLSGNSNLPPSSSKNYTWPILFLIILLLCGAIGVIITYLMSNSANTFVQSSSGNSCQSESPSPQDAYTCYVSRCTFDVSLCSEYCPFGFKRDERYCESECICADKGVFEGDIFFDENELPALIEKYGYGSTEQDFATFSGSASAFDYRLWNEDFIGGKYIVKYALSDSLDELAVENIRTGIATFHDKSCIKFEEVPVGYNKMHILFTDDRYCSSPVGRRHILLGNTEVTIGASCSVRSVKHELLHALGFDHEQARPDRDSYVEIFEHNIINNMKHNFEKLQRSEIRDLNSEYDTKSIMHYGNFAFSKNWQMTIGSRTGEGLGGLDFSKEDLFELNALYRCPKSSSSDTMQWGTWSSWTQCDATCGLGEKVRYRKCLSQSNEYANYCEGSASEHDECKLQSCAGEWGEWRTSGACSRTCGYGYRWLARTCFDINRNCRGRFFKIVECNRISCKKNALWAQWSSWSQCSASCGKTTASRVRFCQDSNGNKLTSCDFRQSDKQSQKKSCNLPSCESFMKIWGSWSQCSATCEGYRRRKCTGGRCASTEEVDNCATRPCKEPDIFAKSRESLNINDVCNAAFTMNNWVFGDFNGDARLDIVCLDLYGVYQLSYGSSSGFDKVWAGSFERCDRGILIAGDVNGDGKGDLICKSTRERLLLIKYALDKRFHDDVIEGGDFCAKYTSDLTVIMSVGQIGLLCHSSDHIIEMRMHKA